MLVIDPNVHCIWSLTFIIGIYEAKPIAVEGVLLVLINITALISYSVPSWSRSYSLSSSAPWYFHPPSALYLLHLPQNFPPSYPRPTTRTGSLHHAYLIIIPCLSIRPVLALASVCILLLGLQSSLFFTPTQGPKANGQSQLPNALAHQEETVWSFMRFPSFSLKKETAFTLQFSMNWCFRN